MILLLFIFGLFIGSFLNVVIDRLPRGESVIVGRSHCDMCHHTLAWYDLVPILSFVSLRGKCRYCKKFIGYNYPIIELSTGTLFIITFLALLPHQAYVYHMFLNWEFILTLGFYLFVTSALLIIFFTDLWYGIIPDAIEIPLLCITLLHLFFSPQSILVSISSGIASFLLFFFLFLITRGKGMGLGDVKFAFVMGLLLGWPSIVVGLYIAFLTGAAVALILVLVRKKRFHGGTIAFGPFLVVATFVSEFFGASLWHILLNLL